MAAATRQGSCHDRHADHPDQRADLCRSTGPGLPRELSLAARAHLFALAGMATLLMTAAVGANQLLLVATGLCPASLVTDRLLARRATPRAPGELRSHASRPSRGCCSAQGRSVQPRSAGGATP